MPQDIHGGVDQRRSEDRARLAPRPSVEKARDGSEQHVAPVGKAHVGDVGETKKKGSGPPAREFAFGSTSQHVLEQAAKKKFFRPGGKKENAEREQRQRFPLAEARGKFDEVDGLAQRNGDAAEDDEAGEHEKAPVAAPADGLTDAIEATQENERGQRDVHAEQHRENVRKAPTGIGPQPVRRREFHGHPNSRYGYEVLPAAGWLPCCRSCERKRDENKTGDRGGTRECESICSQGVNQVDKEHRDAKQKAAAGAEACGKAFRYAARGKKKHHQKENREGRQRSRKAAAAITEPRGIKRSRKRERGPQAEHGKRADLASGGQTRIVTQSDGRPNPTGTSTPRLHRLDARPGVRADVPDACYDSWLSPEARNSALMAWSRLGGTLPAPLFIFLAGISVALVTEKMREMKGI